jgi:hypothetical protein
MLAVRPNRQVTKVRGSDLGPARGGGRPKQKAKMEPTRVVLYLIGPSARHCSAGLNCSMLAVTARNRCNRGHRTPAVGTQLFRRRTLSLFAAASAGASPSTTAPAITSAALHYGGGPGLPMRLKQPPKRQASGAKPCLARRRLSGVCGGGGA